MNVVKKSDSLNFENMDCSTEFSVFDLISNKDTLTINYDEKANLHIKFNSRDNSSFIITTDDNEIFTIFDNLYKSIICGKPYGSNKQNDDCKDTSAYNSIVDRKKRIVWNSEDNSGNVMVICKKDKEMYEIQFYGSKINDIIDITVNGYNSSYYPFNSSFLGLYLQLQNMESLEDENTDKIGFQFFKKRKIS